jgi:hypothetical protein
MKSDIHKEASSVHDISREHSIEEEPKELIIEKHDTLDGMQNSTVEVNEIPIEEIAHI